eukprot:6747265-Karenia_brevis.AAC.1
MPILPEGRPIVNTFPTIEPDWSAYVVGQGADISHWTGTVQIYTDGSGGSYSGDPRPRRCG